MNRTLTEIGITLLGPLYGAYAGVNHRRVQAGMADAKALSIPVCSIGNISFGGTAKTPMAQYVAIMLGRRGRRPGIVLRGWKGRIDREGGPPAVVSDGKHVLLEWFECGDEAALLAESLLPYGVPVAVGRDRLEACRLLLNVANVDAIVLDDGFQHTKLARDLDLVLIDCLSPFGRYDGRPGPLREPVSAMSRADAIILTRADAVDEHRVASIMAVLGRRLREVPPIFMARTRVHDVTDDRTGVEQFPFVLEGRRVLGFSGIGNPLGFRSTLDDIGCGIAGLVVFPDHHPFRRRDLENVNRRACAAGAEAIVTTSKDAVRLDGCRDMLTLPLHIVEIRVTIDDEARFERFVIDRLGIS